jgi:hypothetical protein
MGKRQLPGVQSHEKGKWWYRKSRNRVVKKKSHMQRYRCSLSTRNFSPLFSFGTCSGLSRLEICMLLLATSVERRWWGRRGRRTQPTFQEVVG